MERSLALRRMVADNGGWLHRDDLIDDHWSSRQILEARRREGIDLVRRRWLLLPGADPVLRAAATHGAHVSCVSAIRHFGLWIPPGTDTDLPHFAVPRNWPEQPAGRVHRGAPLTDPPRRSLYDSVENVLGHIAACLPEEQAFAVWESAVSSGLTTPERLRSLPWPRPGARELATAVSDSSDSGVESTFVWRARRIGLQVSQQVQIAGHRVDVLIGRRIVVQLDGWAFHRDAAQRRSDIRHDRELVARGYVVLRFDYYDVMHDWPRVETELRRVIARLAA